MEKTLVLLKPSCVQRQLIGEIVNRFERRGLRVAGMKMMQLSDEILREHYAHLVDRPFFPSLAASMQASPVVALALEGLTHLLLGVELCLQVIKAVTARNEEILFHIADVEAEETLEYAVVDKGTGEEILTERQSEVFDLTLSHRQRG